MLMNIETQNRISADMCIPALNSSNNPFLAYVLFHFMTMKLDFIQNRNNSY